MRLVLMCRWGLQARRGIGESRSQPYLLLDRQVPNDYLGFQASSKAEVCMTVRFKGTEQCLAWENKNMCLGISRRRFNFLLRSMHALIRNPRLLALRAGRQ